MKVIISGGGTGGHIYPAIAIAEKAKARGDEILYIGGLGSLEEKVVSARDIAFKGITTAPLHRKSLKIVADLYANFKGMRQAKKAIRKFDPDIVIGTGGFVTAPVLMAAQNLHVKTLLHEQNAYPGLANRYLAKKADAVCLNFITAKEYFPSNSNIFHVGLPVRQQIMDIAEDLNREEAYRYFGIAEEQKGIPTVLITGGSQGAKSINDALIGAYDTLISKGIRIIHLCGKKNYFELKQKAPNDPLLILMPYLEQMEYALAIANLAVARAGASFLSETAVLGLPSILIPYPYATDDHQTANAKSFAQCGAAVVISDKNLNSNELAQQIMSILTSSKMLSQMKEGAYSMANLNTLDEIMHIIDDLNKKTVL